MRKTAIAALLALVVSACGASTAAPDGTTTTRPTTTTSTTTAPTTTTTTQPSTTTTAPAFPVTVEAANGPVTVEQRPTAIVSLSPTATESLFAIGAGDQVVAVDDQSTYPEDAPVSDLSGFSPNVEAIVAYDPDLVVISFDPGDLISSLDGLGIPVILQPAATTFDDVYTQIEQLGAATGHIGDAAALVANMQQAIDAAVAGAPDDVNLTYYHELDPTLYTVTSSTFIGQVYGLFGLTNIADPVDTDGYGYPQLSPEYIIDQDPDLIFLADTICCGQSPETVAARPGWDSLTAVVDGRVVPLDDDIASRWGPRLSEFVQQIAEAITLVPAP